MPAPRKGQASLELLLSLGFILLVFIVVGLLALWKTADANTLKTYTTAKRTADSFADNINTISEQGHGYYRYFTLPGRLHGQENYTLHSGGNIVEIVWGENQAWARPIITGNVTVHCLDYGRNYTNRVANEDGRISITCHRPDLFPINESFGASPATGGVANTVSVDVENDAHVDATANFIVRFTNLDRTDGTCADNHPCTEIGVPGLATGETASVSYTTPAWPAGTYRILVEVDATGAVTESIESNNNVTALLKLT